MKNERAWDKSLRDLLSLLAENLMQAAPVRAAIQGLRGVVRPQNAMYAFFGAWGRKALAVGLSTSLILGSWPLTLAVAAVPSTISYQGNLWQNGIPVNATKTMVFRITNASGATEYWTSGAVAVTVTKGNFKSDLSPTGVSWQTITPYIEVTVDGSVLLPREPLNAVPYALAAGLVDGAVQLSSTQTFSGQNTFLNMVSVSSDVVLTGTLNRSANLLVGGPGYSVTFASSVTAGWFYGNGAGLTGITAAPPPNAMTTDTPQSVSGVKTFVSTLTVSGNAFSVGGSTLVVTSGNLGIGTTNPTQKLMIGNGTQTPLFANVNGLNSNISIGESGNTRFGYAPGTAGLILQANNIPFAVGTFGATDFTLGSDNTARMTIRSDGNLGIGTVSPAQRFTVVGTSSMTASAAASQALIVQGASGQTANLQEWQNNGGGVLSRINSSGQLVGDGSQLTGVVATDVGSPVTMNMVNAKTTTTNGGITITTNVFVSAGNLGIGTTGPLQKLVVLSGGAYVNVGTEPTLSIQNTSNNNYLNILASDTGLAGIQFGRSADAARAQVRFQHAATAAGERLEFVTAVGTNMVIKPDTGNVGIGTTGPATLLDVNGAAQFGSGATKSTFTAAGSLVMASGATITGGGVVVNPMTSTLNLNAVGADLGTTIQEGITVSTHLFVSAGNVGIGTTAPSSKFEVFNGSITVQGTGTGLRVSGLAGCDTIDTNAAGEFACGSDAGGANGWTDTGSVVQLLTDTDNIVIQSTLTVKGNAFSVGGSTLVVTSGNLGIGTTSPTSTLDVRGPIIRGGNTVGSPANTGTSDGPADALILYEAAAYRTTIGMSGAGIYIQNTHSNGPGTGDAIRFFGGTAGVATEVMRIDSGGDVGIGTTGPTARLHVSTTGVSGTTNVVQVTTGTAAGSDVFVVKGDGKVGIGTTGPDGLLHLDSTGIGGTRIELSNGSAGGQTWAILSSGSGNSEGAGKLSFAEAGGVGVNTRILTLQTNGNVGIGTTNPSSKFEVFNGSITVQGTGTGLRVSGLAGCDTIDTNAAGEFACGSDAGGANGWTDTGSVVQLITGTDNVVVQSTLTVQGNAFSVGTSTLVVTSGNVGIGTTSPNASGFGATHKVTTISGGSGDAMGILELRNPAPTTTSGIGAVAFVSNATEVGRLEGVADGAANSGYLRFSNTNAGVFSEKMRITSSGNLGIGTTGPTARLHVSTAGVSGTTNVVQVTTGTAAGSDVFVVKGDGKVGIGTTGPGYKLEVSGDIGVKGADNRISFFNTDNTDYATVHGFQSGAVAGLGFNTDSVGNAMVIQNNGNVGIGTTAPSSKFEVFNGSITVQGTGTGLRVSGLAGCDTIDTNAAGEFACGSDAGGANGWTDTGSVVQLLIGTDNVVVQSTLTVQSNAFSVGTSTLVVTSGNVGIGTTSPNYKLETSITSADTTFGAIAAYAFRLSNPDATANNYVALAFGDGSATATSGIAGITTDHVNDYGDLNFMTRSAATGWSEKMRITSTGNLGIGTTSPEARLHVSTTGVSAATEVFTVSTGSVASAKVLSVMGNGLVGIGTTSPAVKFEIAGTNADADFSLRDNSANSYGGVFRIRKSRGTAGSPAAVGLNDEVATMVFQGHDGSAYGTAASIRALIDGATGAGDMPGRLEFYTTPDGSAVDAVRMTINNAGNLGIGTTGPTARLHVSTTGVSGTTNVVQVTTGTAAGSDVLVVKGDGNVGIGTTSPDLGGYGGTVQTIASATGGVSELTTTASDASGNTVGRLGFGATANTGGSKNIAIVLAATSGSTANNRGGNLQFWTKVDGGAVTEKMRIDSSGNLGIGTTGPNTKLEVYGGQVADSNIEVFRAGGCVGNDCGILKIRSQMSALTGTSRMSSIQVTEGGGTARNLALQPDGGNVGIGTTDPGAKLEVAGQVKITGGTPGAGKVLTSDAAGLATWATPAGGLTSVQTFSANGTWTKPAGITKVIVHVWGGGGGGGAGAGTGAGGGGGGGHANKFIDVSAIPSETVTVGLGGAGGVGGTNNGAAGGTSSFGANVSATGGGGNSGFTGGTPGVGSSGNLNVSGARGGLGNGSLGADGGSAALGSQGGAGGGATVGALGSVGSAPGGGGGGGRSADGGAGGAGQVIVWEFK